MPRGGTLLIRTTLVDASAGRVRLEVEDSGDGMTEEVKAQIFDPFFTTKSFGHGTGLGLSTVYGILRKHGATITVDSAPDQGTTFSIEFAPTDGSPEPVAHGEPHPLTPGTGTILLVEDDEVVRMLATTTLRRAGYRVIAHGDPREGAAALRGGDSWDLLLTDMVMPRMSGEELVRIARELHPDLPAIVMSGYTGEPDVDLGPGTQFLAKPFTPGRLAEAVAARLGG
jgi:two-component system cell cycle sensor histidine kinase/response regulator CckA